MLLILVMDRAVQAVYQTYGPVRYGRCTPHRANKMVPEAL